MTDSIASRIKAAIVARNEDLLQEEEYDARIYYEDIDGWAAAIAAALAPRMWEAGESVPGGLVVMDADGEIEDDRGSDVLNEDGTPMGTQYSHPVWEVTLPEVPAEYRDDEDEDEDEDED